jgi:uncharacterized protein YbjT (DUF2867 family)
VSEVTRSVLVVGASGSIGRHVLEQATEAGHTVRALVRSAAKARGLPMQAHAVVGDLTQPETLAAAVAGVDAVVFTHGTDGQGQAGAQSVDYGGVRNVLAALGGRRVRIALMTAIGVTNREGDYNRTTQAHDWKRRGERLVRASGLPYTIVRPGWFDYHAPDQLRLVALQGDARQSGTPEDGVVSRRQIAQVLVASLGSQAAQGKTFELVAVRGAATEDFEGMFDGLAGDVCGGLDAVRDADNMPLEEEPQRVREELASVAAGRDRGR